VYDAVFTTAMLTAVWQVDVESKLKAALDHSKRNTSQQQQQDGEDDLDE
jgi:hypothetical protein